MHLRLLAMPLIHPFPPPPPTITSTSTSTTFPPPRFSGGRVRPTRQSGQSSVHDASTLPTKLGHEKVTNPVHDSCFPFYSSSHRTRSQGPAKQLRCSLPGSCVRSSQRRPESPACLQLFQFHRRRRRRLPHQWPCPAMPRNGRLRCSRVVNVRLLRLRCLRPHLPQICPRFALCGTPQHPQTTSGGNVHLARRIRASCRTTGPSSALSRASSLTLSDRIAWTLLPSLHGRRFRTSLAFDALQPSFETQVNSFSPTFYQQPDS